MRCEHCHNTLPDDSRFCQFCGKAIRTPVPAPAPKPAPPHFHTAPATKTVFCRLCGKPIDDATKRCLGCGKQYFRGIKPMTFLCVVLVLALLGMAVVCIVQEYVYLERINELNDILAAYKTAQ